jgi:hypothetical protein
MGNDSVNADVKVSHLKSYVNLENFNFLYSV